MARYFEVINLITVKRNDANCEQTTLNVSHWYLSSWSFMIFHVFISPFPPLKPCKVGNSQFHTISQTGAKPTRLEAQWKCICTRSCFWNVGFSHQLTMGSCPFHIPAPFKSALQLPPPVLAQLGALWKEGCTMQRKHEQPCVVLNGVSLRAVEFGEAHSTERPCSTGYL